MTQTSVLHRCPFDTESRAVINQNNENWQIQTTCQFFLIRRKVHHALFCDGFLHFFIGEDFPGNINRSLLALLKSTAYIFADDADTEQLHAA